MKRIIPALAILFLPLTAHAAPSSLKVHVVDNNKPLSDVRVTIGNLRQRTDASGTVVFQLNPGKYTVEGPKGKTDAWVFRDLQTIAVLQDAEIKLKADRDNLGEFPYEGGTYELTLTYETPTNMAIKIDPSGIPADWKVTVAPETIRPDTQAKVSITIPEASRGGSECIQFLGTSGSQVVAATALPIKLTRGWKNKPKSMDKSVPELNWPLTFNIQSTRVSDKDGVGLDTDFDVKFASNLTSRLSGTALIRLTHAWEPRDTLNHLDFRLANLTYMLPLVNITLGRIDLSPIIQSGEYFGSYLTLGQRRFDGVFALMPISLFGTAGVDAQGFKLPPVALSAGYFPNFFSFVTDDLSYDNGFLFAELKWPLLLFDNPLMITLNYAFATDYAYLKYSPLSGDPAASLNLNYTYSQNYGIYSEFAVCNVTEVRNTTALMVGAAARNLGAFSYGILDEVTLEYQIPLISSTDNPFVGGNRYFPDEAQAQQGAWYLRARSRLEGLELTAAVTNSVGDFTLARPAENAFEPYRVFVLNDRRTANEVADLGKTLISSAYDKLAFLLTIGARF